MLEGVGKSGCPMQNETMSLPWRTRPLTSARTTKAFSVPRLSPRRLILSAVFGKSDGGFIAHLHFSHSYYFSSAAQPDRETSCPPAPACLARRSSRCRAAIGVSNVRGHPSISAHARQYALRSQTDEVAMQATTTRAVPRARAKDACRLRTAARAACAGDQAEES